MQYFIEKYRPYLGPRALAGICRFVVPNDGVIKEFDIHAPTITGEDWLFAVRQNGSYITPTDPGDPDTLRLGVSAPDDNLGALSIAAAAGDVLQVDLIAFGTGGAWSGFEFCATIDDEPTLNSLSDVDDSGKADGDVLTYDDGSGNWVPGPPGGSLTLNDLTNVNETGKADGDVLTYDDGSGNWVPGPPGGSLTLNDLTNVNETGKADGDLLKWDAGAGNWVPATLATLLGGLDAMRFRGVIDCSANPNYPAANAGDVYKVSVAGRIGGASGPKVEVNELLSCTVDGSASGNHATVGANWVISQTNIDGAVTGPTSSTSGNVATFNGTGGNAIQDGGKALPSGAIAGTSDTQTLTNKRITARVQSVSSAATVTPDADADDEVVITAQAAALTIAAPSGTPTQGQPLIIRIKDNGTARAITWNAAFRAIGVTLPTTTVISKTHYIGCIYNSTDSKWDAVGVNAET